MHLLNPQLFIHAHLFLLQSPSLKEKDLQNILASPVSEGFCRPDSTAAARQFPPCPTPANVNPDYLYRKSLALPQNCPKLQLLPENVETLLKTMGVEKSTSRGNNGWKMSVSDKKQPKAIQERGDSKIGSSVSLDLQHTQ